MSCGRSQDLIDKKTRLYLETKRHVEAYYMVMQASINIEHEATMRDVLRKMGALLVFDFEAAIHLKEWDRLSRIIKRAKRCKNEALYKAMGDCLLRSLLVPENGPCPCFPYSYEYPNIQH